MVAMASVPIKPATEAPTIVPVGIDGGGVVPVIESAVLCTSEIALDMCGVPLVVTDAEFTGATVVVAGAVRLYKHSPANQESYIASSVLLQDDALPKQGGCPCEQIQFLVYSRQAFSFGSSKHLRAQDGTPPSSTGFTDGHWVAYQSSVEFQHL